MENETTESMDTESTESTETEGIQTEDNSYDTDYKDDFSIDTEGSETDNQNTDEEYSSEDINSAMMDYLRDNYEMPDKFKDVESLINSYKHLEGKMGQTTGAPDTYELEAGVFDNYSEGVLEGVVGTAREMGLSNDGLNQLLGAAMKSQTQEAEANWEIEKGKMGQNADREIADALQSLNANFSPEISETIQGMIQTADQFYAFRDLMQGGKPSAPAQAQAQSQAPTDADIQKMLFAKDEYGNSKMETDSQYASKVNNLMRSQW